MTVEKAIRILEEEKEESCLLESYGDGDTEWAKAYNMAIYALKHKLKIGRCKDCKYFVYNEFAIVNGIPIIVAHEICSKWGNGCRTKEDGYCHMFEQQESEDVWE